MSIVIEPRTRQYDDAITDAINSFPIVDDKPTLQRYVIEPDVAYASGVHDLITLFSDPTFFKIIVGIGTAVAVGPGKKISELIAQDLYSWFKDKILKRTCEKFPEAWGNVTRSDPMRGVRVKLRYGEGTDFLLDIIYAQSPKEAFDERILTTHFRVFENMIRPLVNHLAQGKELAEVMIQAWVGPGESREPDWGVLVDGEIILVVTTKGAITRDKTNKLSRVVRQFLQTAPSFVLDNASGIFHWRNCEKIAGVKLARSRGSFSRKKDPIDYSDGIQKGFQPCDFCIG